MNRILTMKRILTVLLFLSLVFAPLNLASLAAQVSSTAAQGTRESSSANVIDLLTRGVLRLRVESSDAVDSSSNGITVARLPPPSTANPGRVLRVADSTGAKTIHVDAGARGWVALDSPVIHAAWFDIKGDGTTDNTKAVDSAIKAIAGSGYTLQFGAGTYGWKTKVGDATSGVKIRGLSPEQTVLKKLANSPERFLFKNIALTNWEISDLTIDGNNVGGDGQTIGIYNSRNFAFTNVHFRNASSALYNTAGFKCVRCAFWGTTAGVMKAGTDRPTPNPRAVYQNGFAISSSVNDTTFEDCTFHFNQNALHTSQNAADRSRKLNVLRNDFRGDWWNQPYVISAFTAASFTAGGGAGGGGIGGGILTINEAGAVPTTANTFNSMALTVEVGAGAEFTRAGGAAGDAITLDVSVVGVKKGDSFETADGRRAEVIHAPDATSLVLTPWESMDTFELTAFPQTTKVSWKIRRYYGAFMHPAFKPAANGKSIDLYAEFYNPHDGEAFSSTGLSYAGREIRMFARGIYQGIHLTRTAGYDEVRISGNTFRGSRADQVSLFGVRGARITDNFITLGSDEGITLTNSHDTIVANNKFHSQGASFIYAASNNLSVTGNQGTGWSGVNRHVGAIDVAGSNSAFTGNVFRRENFPRANTAFVVKGTSDNTIIAANTEDAIKQTMLMQLAGSETAYNLILRDARNVAQSPFATNSNYSINSGSTVSDEKSIAPTNANVDNNRCSPYLDETTKKWKLRCRKSDGTYLDFELIAVP